MKKKPTHGPIIEPYEKRMRELNVFSLFLEESKNNNIKIPKIAMKNANFLEDFFDRNSTQKFILKLRKKLEIPEVGFELTNTELGKLMESHFFIPSLMLNKTLSTQKVIISKLRLLEKKIMIMNFNAMSAILRAFLFYNAYNYEFASYLISKWSLCKIINLQDELLEYQPGNKYTNESFFGHLKHEKKYYPISIRINPYVGQRELINFIESNWSEIKKEQTSFVEKSNPFINYKVKRAEFRDRDRLIFENRHLPERDICKLIKQHFPVCPYLGEIGGIIYKEIKRRED